MHALQSFCHYGRHHGAFGESLAGESLVLQGDAVVGIRLCDRIKLELIYFKHKPKPIRINTKVAFNSISVSYSTIS